MLKEYDQEIKLLKKITTEQEKELEQKKTNLLLNSDIKDLVVQIDVLKAENKKLSEHNAILERQSKKRDEYHT